MDTIQVPGDLRDRVSDAVRTYWRTRLQQRQRQAKTGTKDQGLRGAVTGGAQMDGFVGLLVSLAKTAGIPESCIFHNRALELPGFFRPTKEWDLLVVVQDCLLAAVEVKSHAGPSFGNNFNNRTEEAMGSALDLWTAFRAQTYLKSPAPFLGYFFMLEDCLASNHAVAVKEPHFQVDPEFMGASYNRRYELFCRRLILERQYTATAFLTSSKEEGIRGVFRTPADDLSIERFAVAFLGHLRTHGTHAC